MGKKVSQNYGMKLISESDYLTKLEGTVESTIQIGWPN